MKTGLLFVFLLGFGYIAPLSCSKKQAADESKPKSDKKVNRKGPQQMVLFAPVGTIKPAPRKV